MSGCIVAVVSDLHTGSTTGLCVPRFTLDDGGDYVANPLQKHLWKYWKQYWKEIEGLKAKHSLPVVTIINGDAHEGDHHNTPQIITRNEADQLRLAVDVIQPILDVADRIFVIRGTPTHTGKAAWREEKLAEDIGAEREAGGTWSWWRLRAEFGGVLFDVAHHPETTGRRNWTRDAAHARIAKIVQDDYWLNGYRPPDVVLRAHTHVRGIGEANSPLFRTVAYTTPPWQKHTSFAYRIGAGFNLDVGGLYFICQDGEVKDWDWIIYENAKANKKRTPRKLSPYRIDWSDPND